MTVGLGAAALAGLGVGLVVAADRDGVSGATTWAAQPAGDLVVAATPMGDSSVVVCLVDRTRQRLAVYVADARRSRLKLLAVRDIAADWALTDYNNDPPLPKDVRARVEAIAKESAGAGTTPEDSGVSPESP